MCGEEGERAGLNTDGLFRNWGFMFGTKPLSDVPHRPQNTYDTQDISTWQMRRLWRSRVEQQLRFKGLVNSHTGVVVLPDQM